jgi:shikimate dehydrogenase
LSPTIHNAAFAAAGLDWVFVAFEVRPDRLDAAIAGVRALGITGLSVTMPHKERVVSLVDEVSDEAALLGAVNCLVADGERLVGHNTDGDGFVAGLADHGVALAGRRVAVLGAGGAARAVVRAAGRAGAASIVIVNRSSSRADAASGLAPVATVGSVADVADADVVVNATPIGMAGGPGEGDSPIAPEVIASRHVVVDLVYHPLRTPLLAAAASAGATPIDGLAMLVGQAALAFERWTGVGAPVETMRRAARDALAGA